MDVRDIAAVAAAALIDPVHEGKTYDITGPEALTHAEMASDLSQALGREVKYIDIPGSILRGTLIGFHVPEWQADGLVEDYEHYRRGEAATISSAIEETTGRAPRDFRSFARDFREAFLQTN